MSVRLLFECSRCGVTATSETRHGQSYGPGGCCLPDLEGASPPGWVPWDPINATYCPDCWMPFAEDSTAEEVSV